MALRPFNVLSLCSGIGGLDLGLAAATNHAARTVCFVEREGYCASVLQARMASGHLDDAPIWSDLKTFDPLPWRGKVDCITAGYPCQPFSVAGKKKGKEDPRHLWPYIKDIVATIEPAILFCENVTGHIALGFEEVCEDLSGLGYHVEAGIFSAQECGAPHRRERLFFVAHANGLLDGRQQHATREGARKAKVHARGHGPLGPVADAAGARRGQRQREARGALWHQARGPQPKRLGGEMADANSLRQLQQGPSVPESQQWPCNSGGHDSARATQSTMGEPTDGLSDVVAHIEQGWDGSWEDGVPRVTDIKQHRIDALRALGNAVVPAAAANAWRTLSEQVQRRS